MVPTFWYKDSERFCPAGTNIIDSSDRDVEDVTGGGARREREGHCDWSWHGKRRSSLWTNWEWLHVSNSLVLVTDSDIVMGNWVVFVGEWNVPNSRKILCFHINISKSSYRGTWWTCGQCYFIKLCCLLPCQSLPITVSVAISDARKELMSSLHTRQLTLVLLLSSLPSIVMFAIKLPSSFLSIVTVIPYLGLLKCPGLGNLTE